MGHNDVLETIANWNLPEGASLLERIDRMVEPAILAGHFGSSSTQMVSGIQYHLGGSVDTRQLAELAELGSADHVLDVCCYLGGPAVQLAEDYDCRVTGIDRSETAVVAARRIATLAGMSDRLAYFVADAVDMPFDDGTFDVIGNQGSLAHDPAWLREFDRLLRPGGRLALVFEIRPDQTVPGPDDHRWTLEETVAQVQAMGYRIEHMEDLMEREIDLGWSRLIHRLDERREIYAAARGEAWVEAARAGFVKAIAEMQQGVWSNGRLVALKPEA